MAVNTYTSEASLAAAIGATSVVTYDSEQALAGGNPLPADKVLAVGGKFTLVKGGTYVDIVAKGRYYTVIT